MRIVSGIYLASAGASMLGNAVSHIAWPWLVLNRTGDPAAAGIVATAVAIPSLIIAIVGGQLVDKVGRKPVSILSDLISGASVAALILVDQNLGVTLGWFIALGIIGAVGDVPGMAARNALITDVSRTSGVTVDKLSAALQALTGITFLLGPALAGVLMSLVSIELVLWITAACSFLAAALTMLLRITHAAVDPTEDVFRGWRAWGSIVQRPEIKLFVWVALTSGLMVSPLLLVLLPAHFESVDKPLMLGLAMSAFAVGMIVAGGLVGWLGTAYRRRVWGLSMALFSLAFFGTAFLSNQWAVLLGMAAAGLASGLFGPVHTLTITEVTSEQVRGRAFSLFTAINLFVSPIGLSLTTLALKFHTIYWLAVALFVFWAPISVWAIWKGYKVLPHYKEPA